MINLCKTFNIIVANWTLIVMQSYVHAVVISLLVKPKIKQQLNVKLFEQVLSINL